MKFPEEYRTVLVLASTALLLAVIVSCGALVGGASGEPTGVRSVAQADAIVSLNVSSGATIAPEDVDRLPAGQRAFAMPDGTRVVVTTAEPLPGSVRSHVQGQVDTVIPDPGVPGRITTNRSLIVDTAQGIAKKVGLQTGKQIVFVYPLIGSCPSTSEPYLGWSHTAITYYDAFPCDVVPTLEEAEQRVAAVIAAQSDPERYAVFVHGK